VLGDFLLAAGTGSLDPVLVVVRYRLEERQLVHRRFVRSDFRALNRPGGILLDVLGAAGGNVEEDFGVSGRDGAFIAFTASSRR